MEGRFYGSQGLAVLAFVVLGFVIYSNTLEGPFVFDDLNSIKANRALRITSLSFSELEKAAFKGRSARRPVAYVSFALNYYVHGLNPVGYHVTNIAIHVAAAVLVYFFIAATLGLPTCRLPMESGGIIAFFAALLWLVSPVQTESVSYIVQRMNSLSAMFYILALLLYVRGRIATSPRGRWLSFCGCALAGLLALGSKEIALTLPFFILLYEWYFFQDLSKAWLKRILPYLIGVMAVLGILVTVILGPGAIRSVAFNYSQWDFSLSQRILTEFRVVMYYIGLLLFPHPSRLNLDYDILVSHGLLQPPTTLLSMAAIIFLIGLAVRLAKKERVLSFCILWFFGNLVIESSVIPLDLVFEHRAYLPSIFFFLIVVILAFRLLGKGWVAMGAMGAIIVVSCFWTYQRNTAWTDPVMLWADCAVKSPNKARPQVNLGNALSRRGQLDEAIFHYKKALSFKPDHYMAHVSLGAALVRKGRLDEAVSHYLEALKIKPQYWPIYHSLGIVFTRKGDLKNAVSYYKQALRLNPEYAEAHTGLGVALARQGKLDAAISHYRKALRIKPGDRLARMNLSEALAGQSRATEGAFGLMEKSGKPDAARRLNMRGVDFARQGQSDEAIASFTSAIKVKDDYAEAYFNRGMVLAGLGRIEDAVADYTKALNIKPDYAEVHNNLGIILAGQGRLHEARDHFVQALEARPGFEQARNNLERAERLLNTRQ